MITLTLPNGDALEVEQKTTVHKAIEKIGSGLARDALTASLDGDLVDLSHQIRKDADFKVYTWKDEEGKEVFRHTTAHILAQALLRHYPDAQITIGPPTQDGFYYDIDYESFSPEDLDVIEDEMRKIVEEEHEITREEVSVQKARKLFSNNRYKQELLDDIEETGETVSIYKQGEFTDLCRGPHLPNTSYVKAPKLLRVSGAYWKGDESNKQLQRIYGTSFPKQKSLDTFIERRKEAKKRDHRKLGVKHGLYTNSALVGKGLPLFGPAGSTMRHTLINYLWDLHKKEGYDQVTTPHITKWDLYETSGHADKFGDELFTVEGKTSEFVIKPMNCPHHTQIFDSKHHSYRDLPIRYFEPGVVYRDEQSGELSGLLRVRSITQDDGHIFCTPGQIEKEVGTVVKIIKQFYKRLDMLDDYWVSLSVRDPDKDEYLGSDEIWNKAETALKDVAEKHGLPYKRVEGEAAFYGPKLDFMFRDALGREWQLATAQLDFNLPTRFELTYDDENGEKQTPVMIHRAITGSLERFMGVMIEHFNAAFPLWLSPKQVEIISVSDETNNYAYRTKAKLENGGYRVTVDTRDETVSKKIREAELNKTPYVLVVGSTEEENETVNVRSRDQGVIGEQPVEEFLDTLSKQT